MSDEQENPPAEPESTTDPTQSVSVIRRMEQKVSKQWQRAKSGLLAFTGGFSFKRGLPSEPKVIGRREPTGKLEQRGNPLGCVLVCVVVVSIVGGVLAWLVHHERSKQPAEGPLIFDGPK